MLEGRTAQRFEISIQGRYRTGCGVARDVPILDISETGCRMFDRFGRLLTGTVVSLRIGPIGPIIATVAWCKESVVGMHFERALYGPVFEHIRERLDARPDADAISMAG